MILVKKHVYILAGLIFFILGMVGAFTSIKLPLALVAAVVFLSIILLDYQKATYIVALYTVIDYFLRKVFQSGMLSGNWDELFFILCVCLWVYKWLVQRKIQPYRWTPMEFPIIIFMGISLFLLFFSTPNLRIGIEGLRAIIEYIFWFFVTVQLLKTTRGAKHLIYVLLLVGTFIALDGIRQYVFGAEMPKNWVDKAEYGLRRVYSIVVSPNILGSLMTLLAPISVSMVFFERRISKKIFFIIASLLVITCLIFTGSRSAWIGFMVAALVMVALLDKRLILPSILVLGTAAAAAMVFFPSVGTRISYLLSDQYMANSIKGGRVFRWTEGLNILKQHLFFGVGLGHFGGAVAINNKIRGTFYMDNYYLKTAVEMGLVGLTAFLALMYNAVVWSLRTVRKLKTWRYAHIARGGLAGMCGVLVHCLFENIFEAPLMVTYFWLVAGVIMYLGYVAENETIQAIK